MEILNIDMRDDYGVFLYNSVLEAAMELVKSKEVLGTCTKCRGLGFTGLQPLCLIPHMRTCKLCKGSGVAPKKITRKNKRRTNESTAKSLNY